jgi:hypothetical protein
MVNWRSRAFGSFDENALSASRKKPGVMSAMPARKNAKGLGEGAVS